MIVSKEFQYHLFSGTVVLLDCLQIHNIVKSSIFRQLTQQVVELTLIDRRSNLLRAQCHATRVKALEQVEASLSVALVGQRCNAQSSFKECQLDGSRQIFEHMIVERDEVTQTYESKRASLPDTFEILGLSGYEMHERGDALEAVDYLPCPVGIGRDKHAGDGKVQKKTLNEAALLGLVPAELPLVDGRSV